MPQPRPELGVEIVGTGRYLPQERLTNADLEKVMDTSDEWIVQRTGIKERRRASVAEGETVDAMSAEALRIALRRAGVAAHELDLLITATVCSEMTCPSTACQVLGRLQADTDQPIRAGAFDLTAACSGFVYALNLAHEMLRSGHYRTAAVIGVERLTEWMDYATHHRDHAIIFGDGAGAAVLRATPDATKGAIAHTMHADGSRWSDLYMPSEPRHFPEGEFDETKIGLMRMNGRGVFKFAVTTFGDAIQECLERSGLNADDIDQFVCHQSNVRILEAARERFGLPPEKLYINIERYGNTSAASVPLCLDELTEQGRIKPGMKVMFVAFGGGLTWTTSLWQL